MNFLSWQNYLGGGGAKWYVCPPPPIFSLGGGGGDCPPPPPPPGSTPLSVQCVLMFVTLVRMLWSCSWRFIPNRNFPETREKSINGCERAERASRNFCTFASETYIPTRKPETHEKTILIASEPTFVVFWGLKHTILLNILLINHMVNFVGTINYVLVFVTLVIWSCSWWFIPTRKPETREKHMYASERSERAAKFGHLNCVGNMWFFSISQ